MIEVIYGIDGVNSAPFESEQAAIAEFDAFYKNNSDYAECYVTEYRDGEWFIVADAK